MIKTPDQRVRVFISSTLGDLSAERQAVRAAITQLRRGWTAGQAAAAALNAD